MKLKSTFALLDVERGRVGLEKAVKKNPVKVIIHGEIESVWGHFDGVSQEFSVDVKKVEVIDESR